MLGHTGVHKHEHKHKHKHGKGVRFSCTPEADKYSITVTAPGVRHADLRLESIDGAFPVQMHLY